MRQISRIILCCMVLLCLLAGCQQEKDILQPEDFEPTFSVIVGEQRAELVIDGTLAFPDDTLLNVTLKGESEARKAVLKEYGLYTALPEWCDRQGLVTQEFSPQTTVIKDGKFYVNFAMKEAPSQKYTFEVTLKRDEKQPAPVLKLLSTMAIDEELTAVGEAMYPNRKAAELAEEHAVAGAKAFIEPHLENLDKICEMLEASYAKAIQEDPELGTLSPDEEKICKISLEGDCVLFSLDGVYWDYYIHPDDEVYEITDYRNQLVERWMLPCLQAFEPEITLLYGHKPSGRFLAHDGRVIANMSSGYQVVYEEESELDG